MKKSAPTKNNQEKFYFKLMKEFVDDSKRFKKILNKTEIHRELFSQSLIAQNNPSAIL